MAGKNTVIVLEQKMIKSKAWLSLGNTAMQIYLIFRTKCQIGKVGGKDKHRKYIINNGEIIFTFEEAKKKYDISEGRFNRAIDQLVEHGFLEVTVLGMGANQAANCYAICERWRDYDTEKFKQVKRPKLKHRLAGFQQGNRLGVNSRKNITVTDNSGVTVVHNSSNIVAMFTNNRGQRIKTLYKLHNGKWLGSNIA